MKKGYQQLFDPILYPLKLRVIVECDCEYLHNSFIFVHGDNGFDENTDMFVSFVINKKLEYYEVIVVFRKHEFMTVRNICHEAFHVATVFLKYLNMQMGYEIGQDEHPAYIAGWAGDCMIRVYNKIRDLKAKENGKEKEMVSK